MLNEATTIIIHNVLTAQGKPRVHQPVDRFRKLLKKQRIEFTEEVTTMDKAPDLEVYGSDRRYTQNETVSIFRYSAVSALAALRD